MWRVAFSLAARAEQRKGSPQAGVKGGKIDLQISESPFLRNMLKH